MNTQTIIKPLDARVAKWLMQRLVDTPVTPNHLTTLRLLFGLLAGVGLAIGDFLYANLGALCFVLSSFLDHCDGELARLTGNMSQSGHYYDLISDALVNTVLFLGTGLGLMHTGLGLYAGVLGGIAGLSVALIFHLRNEIEKHIGHDDARQPNMGVVEAEDVLYLLPVVTALQWQYGFLLLAAVGAPLFAAWVVYEYLRLKRDR